MGVTTTSDERRRDAKQNLEEAMRNIDEAIENFEKAIHRDTWGSELREDYIKRVEDDCDKLRKYRRKIREIISYH